MNKKVALVLSGGGAKGAFQFMAEKYAREVKGYRWDIIAGVSVGALNGTMLAMGKYKQLEDIWLILLGKNQLKSPSPNKPIQEAPQGHNLNRRMLKNCRKNREFR